MWLKIALWYLKRNKWEYTIRKENCIYLNYPNAKFGFQPNDRLKVDDNVLINDYPPAPWCQRCLAMFEKDCICDHRYHQWYV